MVRVIRDFMSKTSQIVIPAKAGIQEEIGYLIKSSVIENAFNVLLLMNFLVSERR